MSVDFKTFLKIVPHVVDIKKPVLLRGRHGIGKSEIVYQFAEAKGLPVVERRASQMTEGDLLGLPSVEGQVTTWCAPDWLHRACNEPVLLFLDGFRGYLSLAISEFCRENQIQLILFLGNECQTRIMHILSKVSSLLSLLSQSVSTDCL